MARKSRMAIGVIGDALVTVNEAIGEIVDHMERPSSTVGGRSEAITEAREMAARLARDLLVLSIRLTSAARMAATEERIENLKIEKIGKALMGDEQD
jgi:hypothetical protein